MFGLSSTVPEMRVLFRSVIIHNSSIPVLVAPREGDATPLMAGYRGLGGESPDAVSPALMIGSDAAASRCWRNGFAPIKKYEMFNVTKIRFLPVLPVTVLSA